MATRENAPQEPQGNEMSEDQIAWNTEAARYNARVHDGKVWGGVNGMLFAVPPLPGFAMLPEPSRQLVFRSIYQHSTYRVAQNAEGVVSDAVHKAITGGPSALPGIKSNDAFEKLWSDQVAAKIEATKGALPDSASTADKAARRKMIEDSAANESNRSRFFDLIRDRGIAAGLAALPAKERKRAKATAKTGGEELDFSA